MLFSPLAFLFLCSHLVTAILVNVTVDDDGQDPMTGSLIQYGPPGAWSFGQNCTKCLAKPDPSQIYNGTWHDGTYLPNSSNPSDVSGVLTATFQFSGTALYVYCILVYAGSSIAFPSDMAFTLDGHDVGIYLQPPSGTATYEYNVPVYVNTSIPNGLHTFTLKNGRDDGQGSVALVDYFIYTQDTGSSPSQTNDNSAPAFPTQNPIPSPSGSPDAITANDGHRLSGATPLFVVLTALVGGLLFL